MQKRIDITIDDGILIEFRKRCLDLKTTASQRIQKLMLLDNQKKKR